MRLITLAFTLSFFAFMTACAAPGDTKLSQRQHIDSMKKDVLAQLYKLKSDAREEIRNAPGYAVLSNVNIYLLFVSAGTGYGVVTDNDTAKKTYMKMGEAGVGIGAGAKDFRLVFVFQSRKAMNNFVEQGWVFGGQADAAAKANEKGAAVGGELMLDGIKVYQLTETGLALQVTVKGTKYWPYDELN